jgi:hypothetical protein
MYCSIRARSRIKDQGSTREQHSKPFLIYSSSLWSVWKGLSVIGPSSRDIRPRGKWSLKICCNFSFCVYGSNKRFSRYLWEGIFGLRSEKRSFPLLCGLSLPQIFTVCIYLYISNIILWRNKEFNFTLGTLGIEINRTSGKLRVPFGL